MRAIEGCEDEQKGRVTLTLQRTPRMAKAENSAQYRGSLKREFIGRHPGIIVLLQKGFFCGRGKSY